MEFDLGRTHFRRRRQAKKGTKKPACSGHFQWLVSTARVGSEPVSCLATLTVPPPGEGCQGDCHWNRYAYFLPHERMVGRAVTQSKLSLATAGAGHQFAPVALWASRPSFSPWKCVISIALDASFRRPVPVNSRSKAPLFRGPFPVISQTLGPLFRGPFSVISRTLWALKPLKTRGNRLPKRSKTKKEKQQQADNVGCCFFLN